MYFRTLIFALALTPSISMANQDLRKFVAPVNDSVWLYNGDRQKCSLSHEIPGYGRLNIAVRSGEEELSNLNLYYNRGIEFDRAELYFGRNSWQPNNKVKEGWFFQFGDYRDPIDFSSRQTRQLLDGLNDGLQPIITHLDNTDRTVEVLAVVSPVMFKAAYEDYQRCVRNMLPISWYEIRNSEIYFESGSVRLDDEAKTWLNYVLDYAADPAIMKIELTGYTDSVGNHRDNHQLASSRVEMVRNYLVNAGFDERKLRLKVLGEQAAKYDNQKTESRAKNRRVAIKIYR